MDHIYWSCFNKTLHGYSIQAKIKTDQEVKKATISAYGNALVSQERVEILKRNIKNVEKI